MSITIDLPPEIEANLREHARQAGVSLEQHLVRLAQSWAGVNGAAVKSTPDQLSTEEWLKEWHAWAASHKPLPIIADDSRESIYAGRGE